MCLGRDKLEYHLADFKKRSDSLSKAEQDTLRDMRIVQEMYAGAMTLCRSTFTVPRPIGSRSSTAG